MSEAAQKKSLVQKLAEVMAEVERVAKTGRNNFHGYNYATEADIVASVRGGLASRGVMLVPSVEKIEWTDRVTPKQTLKIATLTVRFTFMDGDSDSKIEFIGMGQGEDASDKAIYKAMTGAEKYALLKTFLIPTGDDPEADATPARVDARPQQPAPSAPRQQPQASTTQAASVKQQLKRGLGIVEVKTGETEAEAKARTAKEQAKPTQGETTLEKQAREAREATPGVYERIEILCAEYGVPKDRVGSIIRGATGKSQKPQLVEEDVAKVRASLEVLQRMGASAQH